MPTLRIVSVFREREREYGWRLVEASRELADFLDEFKAQAGKDAAGILRAYAGIRLRRRPGITTVAGSPGGR